MTGPAFRPSTASASSSASTASTAPAPALTPGSGYRSPAGSSPSTPAGSSPARQSSAARLSSSISLSYALLKDRRHARGMFDIAPDHAIGFYAGLFVLPFALLALRLRRRATMSLPGTVLAASVLMAVAGGIHLGLVWTHRDETITAVLFVMNGTAYIVL